MGKETRAESNALKIDGKAVMNEGSADVTNTKGSSVIWPSKLLNDKVYVYDQTKGVTAPHFSLGDAYSAEVYEQSKRVTNLEISMPPLGFSSIAASTIYAKSLSEKSMSSRYSNMETLPEDRTRRFKAEPRRGETVINDSYDEMSQVQEHEKNSEGRYETSANPSKIKHTSSPPSFFNDPLSATEDLRDPLGGINTAIGNFDPENRYRVTRPFEIEWKVRVPETRGKDVGIQDEISDRSPASLEMLSANQRHQSSLSLHAALPDSYPAQGLNLQFPTDVEQHFSNPPSEIPETQDNNIKTALLLSSAAKSTCLKSISKLGWSFILSFLHTKYLMA